MNETASATPKILGRLLIESASITDLALAAALEKQRQTGQRLGTTLVRMQHCGEEHVARALAKQLSLPYAAPPLRPEVDALPFVGEDLARRNAVVPLGLGPRTVRLAMADPLDLATVDDVRFRTGRRVEAVVASPSAVAEALELALGDDLKIFVDALPGEPVGVDGTDGGSVEAAASATPVVQLVERILEEAVSAGASDVHLERHGEEFRVRLRVDGVLRDVVELPTWSRGAVLSRVKILGGMDISVKRRPQDGGFVYHRMEKRYSVRVSTIPVDKGEKAVMRILDPGRAPADLDGVGLSTADLDVVRRLLGAGHGVILTAGPTGSGKSTTLFGALGEVDRRGQNVVTLEDPIEYRVAGVNQVQVRPRAGLTFPAALRAVLRQDPDVVMVGEIRDQETAEIAMTAAVTGHLVLSSIHTVDAPGAITRLLNMGVPAYLVAGGLAGVIAQRLVRRTCSACRGAGGACSECTNGYRGRTGVFQVLAMTDALRDEVVGSASTSVLRQLAVEAGMGSMSKDARRKVAEGVTTPHELGRVAAMGAAAVVPCAHCGLEAPVACMGCPHCGTARAVRCFCGRELRREWRFCPDCLRRVVR